MAWLPFDGNQDEQTPNYDAGGGGSSWGDNSNQGSGGFWSGISQAISNVANQVQQLPPPQPASDYSPTPVSNNWWNEPAPAPAASYDAGGGGSSWGGSQPDYSWTSSAPQTSNDWGWSSNQDWQNQPFTAAQPSQPDYTQPDYNPLSQYAQTGVQANSYWDNLAASAGNYFSRNSTGPTFYNPSQMFNASQNQPNPVYLDIQKQRQELTQPQNYLSTGTSNLVNAYADSDIPIASQAAQGARWGYQNLWQPLENFTPSIVGDISRGQAPGLFTNFYNYLTDPNYTEEATNRKAGYVNETYQNALQQGYTPEQAAQMAQELDAKLSNFANFSEYEGMRQFNQLPEWAQVATRTLDPVMWGAAGYAGKFVKGLRAGEALPGEARAMNFEAPVEAGGVRPVAAAPAMPADVLPQVDYYARQPFIKSLQESVMAKGELPKNLQALEQNRLNLIKNQGLTPAQYMDEVANAAQRDGLSLDEIYQASGQPRPVMTAPATTPTASTVRAEPAPATVEVNPVQSLEAKPAPAQVEKPPATVEVKPAKSQPAQLPQIDYSDRVKYFENLKDALMSSGKKTSNLKQAVSSRIGYLRNGGTEAGYIERLSKAAVKDGLNPADVWKAAGQEAPANLPNKLPKESNWKKRGLIYGGVGAGVAGLGAGATLYRQSQGQPGFVIPPSTAPATFAPTTSTPSRPATTPTTKPAPTAAPVVSTSTRPTTTSAKVNPVTLPQPTKAAPYQATTQPSFKQQVQTYQKLKQNADTALQAAGYYIDKGDYQTAGEILNHPNFGAVVFAPSQYRYSTPGFTQRYVAQARSQGKPVNPVKVAQSNQPDIEEIREMLRRPAGAIASRSAPASRPTATLPYAGYLPRPSALAWLLANREPGQGVH